MNRYALILCLSAVPSLSAGDWPQFRGPTGDGLYTGAKLPLEWGPDKNVVWTKEIPGHGWSSPIVWKGKVYLTTAVEKGKDYSLQAVGLDAVTGDLLFAKEIFVEPAGSPNPHKKNSHASPTPVTDGERLYVHFGHIGTAAISLDGKQIFWKSQKLPYKPVHGNGGSPILVDDKLVFSCDGGDTQVIAALDRKTGNVAWKTDRKGGSTKGFSFATPQLITVDKKSLIISPGSGMVGAYEPAKGTEVWRVKYDGFSLIPRPVFGGGMVYVATGYMSPTLQAIKPEGKGDITASNVAWTVKRAAPNTPSVLYVDDMVFMVSDGGVATCLNAKTGDPYWSERVPGSGYSASPIYADGKIWVTSESGEGAVIEAKKEFNILNKSNLKERTFASFAAVDGSLYVRTDKNMYRFQEK